MTCRLALLVAAALGTAACGSGGGAGSPSSPMSTGHAVSGKVSGASAVTVTLSGAAQAVTTTDTDGRYHFDGVADGEYVVTPSQAGCLFTPEHLAVLVRGADIANLDFVAAGMGLVWDLSNWDASSWE